MTTNKIMGLKLTAPLPNKDSENAIYYAIREYSSISEIIPDGVIFEESSSLFAESKCRNCLISIETGVKYKLFAISSRKEAEKIFYQYNKQYGNIYGAISNRENYLIIANKNEYKTIDEDIKDATNAMDWYLNKKAEY